MPFYAIYANCDFIVHTAVDIFLIICVIVHFAFVAAFVKVPVRVAIYLLLANISAMEKNV